MSLAISIKNQVTYEDVLDAEEEVKFVEHNVVEGDIPLWQQRCAYLLDNIMHECINSALCVYKHDKTFSNEPGNKKKKKCIVHNYT